MQYLHLCTSVLCLSSFASAQWSGSTENGIPEDAVAGSEAAVYFWHDYDADGLVDVLVLAPGGGGTLLRNASNGQFEDVTVASELFGKADEAFQAVWGDADGDGRVELFLPSYAGYSRMLEWNGKDAFEDVTLASGLPELRLVLDAHFAHSGDGDGADLHVVTLTGERFFHPQAGQWREIELGTAQTDEEPATVPATVQEARRRASE